MKEDDVPVLLEGVAFNDDEVTPTLLNPTTGRIFVTNKIGQRIIELCDGQNKVEDIKRCILNEFSGGAPEVVNADLEGFLTVAVAQGVILWRTNSQ